MNIQKINGTITHATDLTATTREITIALEQPMPFYGGNFVNVFLEENGETLRRAFSLSSDDTEHNTVSLTIRMLENGAMSPLFWREDCVGRAITLMGPLGFNTADKLTKKRALLFAFGVGAGVIKAVAQHLELTPTCEEITIVTGSRNANDMIHKDFFDALAARDNRVTLKYVVTDDNPHCDYPKGFIQNHIAEYSFDDADIYMCGQEVACNGLKEAIAAKNPQNHALFVEAFH